MDVTEVAIVGAGTMGGGIAIGCVVAGLQTRVIDLNEDRLEATSLWVRRFLDRAVEKERLSPAQAQTAMGCLKTGTDLAETASADLVIEAVFEDLDAKHGVLSEIAAHLSPDAIVATNTSALRVSKLAEALAAPERFLGLHYFSPAEVNPLVEVVSGSRTSKATLDKAMAFLATVRKTPLLCRDANGFAVNRFFCPYTNEAARLFGEGIASPAQIDRAACQAFDLPLGPFAVMNIVKPRIALHAVQNLSELGPFYHAAPGLRRAGAELDAWPIDEDDESLSKNVAEDVKNRLSAALFLPVLQAIGERVAAPDDFDLGARLALRFGVPPVAAMRNLGRASTVELITPLATRFGADIPRAGLHTVFD